MNEKSKPFWETSEEGRRRLNQMLRSTGVPFEALVASDARRFASTHSGDVVIEATRLVYGQPHVEEALREIDQSVTMYQEIEVGDVFGIQLSMAAIIECKTRVGLHAFGFPVAATGRHVTPLIIASDIARSRVIRDIASYQIVDSARPQTEIALLVDSKMNGSLKTTDENLVYKAASSLIDFVSLDSALYHEPSAADQVLETVGILDSFKEYVDAHHYWAPGVARRWIQDNADPYTDEFVQSYLGGTLVYDMVKVYCPVVCLDANLFQVDLDLDGDVESIDAVDSLYTGVRTSGWPHALRSWSPWIGPEARIAVVNRTGLQQLLVDLYGWFVKVARKLNGVSTDDAKRLLLESAFLNLVQRQNAENVKLYRSDLDLP